MSTLAQLRQGLHRVLDQMSEGWQQLRERAGQALTRFSPRPQRIDGLQTVADQASLRGARWGLLAAEIEDQPDAVVVRLEAPGMEPDEFDIHVEDDYLVVRGEKQARREQTGGRYYIMECAYGAFERALQLPATVDESRARARYKRGVLTITLPKTAASRSRRIEIRSG
jgi:HSP20 family protein